MEPFWPHSGRIFGLIWAQLWAHLRLILEPIAARLGPIFGSGWDSYLAHSGAQLVLIILAAFCGLLQAHCGFITRSIFAPRARCT